MGRRSSVRGDFLNVKTGMGLERFEVGKSRSSDDVPFRSSIFEYIHLCMSKLVRVKSDSKLENLAAATTSLTDLYGYTTIDGPFLAYFFVNWPRRQSK